MGFKGLGDSRWDEGWWRYDGGLGKKFGEEEKKRKEKEII